MHLEEVWVTVDGRPATLGDGPLSVPARALVNDSYETTTLERVLFSRDQETVPLAPVQFISPE